MELLEPRLTPSAVSPDAAYIQALYAKLLDRPAGQSDFAYWLPILNGPAGRAGVVAGIAESLEARTYVVGEWYQQYLERPVVGTEAQAWIDALTTLPEVDVLAGILSSPEYLADPGGEYGGEVILHDYYAVLNRSPFPNDFGGVVYWNAVLDAQAHAYYAATHSQDYGPVVFQVQRLFLSTTEYRSDVIAGYYTEYLGHVPDQASLNYWLASKLDQASIRSLIFASDEFAGRALTGSLPAPVTSLSYTP